MKEKIKKILSTVIIAGLLLYSLYLIISSGETDIETIRSFAVVVFGSCTLLSRVFSTKTAPPVPAELLENETYMEAKERQDSGGIIAIIGAAMISMPLAVLLIAEELEGFVAELFLLSFFLGILAVLIGLLVVFSAGKDMAAFDVEVVQDPQPESLVSRIFSWIGTLGVGGHSSSVDYHLDKMNSTVFPLTVML